MIIPDMQRRHFQFIADIIAAEWADDFDGRQIAARRFADNLRATNGQFRRAQFLAACHAVEED